MEDARAQLILPYPMKEVRSWRITAADPSGSTMWFDPSYEVPLLGVLPPEQREDDAGSAELEFRLELEGEREVVPLEGGAAKVSEEEFSGPPGSEDLPF